MRSRLISRLALVAVVGATLLSLHGSAAAHPLGNFTISVGAAVRFTPGEVRIYYAVDFAEVPTFQIFPKIDTDGNGDASRQELSAWASQRSKELLAGVSLEIDGGPVPLKVRTWRAVLLPGMASLATLRLDSIFRSRVPDAGSGIFVDRNYADRLGWREISVSGGEGTAIESSTAPRISPSALLTLYPVDRRDDPPNVREARFSYAPGAGGSAPGFPGAPPADSRPEDSSFLEDLVAEPSLSLPVVLLAFAAALGVGALHALAPGHGKTITAAYLAGGRGKARDAIGIGLAVAVLHTATVLVLGLILLIASESLSVDRIYPWLGLVAGATAVGLGAWQLVTRLRHRRTDVAGAPEGTHAHVSRPGVAALAVAGGLFPSPSAVLVLLGSFTLGRGALGVGLVAAFGIGLAASLTAIGMIAVRGRDLARSRLSPKLANLMPVLGSVAIIVMGLVVAVRGIAQL